MEGESSSGVVPFDVHLGEGLLPLFLAFVLIGLDLESLIALMENLSLIVLLLVTIISGSQLMAQGILAPPGAPAPSMKSLDQLEPSIPISDATTPGDDDSRFKITTSGSYYLTGNLGGSADKHGIEIAASDVTLDLMGFELQGKFIVLPGSGPSLSGVYVQAPASNLCVRNGTIKDWSRTGVVGAAENSVFESLRLANNGGNGIYTGNGSIVRECVAIGNGNNGIIVTDGCIVETCTARGNGGESLAAAGITVTGGSVVRGCVAIENDGNGFDVSGLTVVSQCAANQNARVGISVRLGSTVSNCTASFNSSAGISLRSGCAAIGCTARGNGGDGIRANLPAQQGVTVRECTVTNNEGDGIEVSEQSQVIGCTADQNGMGDGTGAGIHVTGADNRIDGNTLTHNDRGLDVDTGGNIIVRNTASGNGQNYAQVVSGNTVGEILNTTGTGGTITEAVSPWANFSF